MFAVLHVADFALHAVLRTMAEAKGIPTALVDATTRIAACTADARALGVETGQTAPQAMARCPGLRVLTPQSDAETEATASLVAAAFSISPCVEATAPGICTVLIDGLPRERREPSLRDALDRLERLGLPATGGIGGTPLLALYAAREAAMPTRAPPTRLLVVRDTHAFLAQLPLAVADPPADLAEIIASWGLRTLGDLTALPKAALAQRLGPAGVALWERAAGEATRPLQPLKPPRTFAAALACEFELETLEPLLFLLRRFVDRLTLELATSALAAAELTLTLQLADDGQLAHTLRLAEPSTDPDTLFRTLHTYLETVRTAAAVVGVALEITPQRASIRQHGLFDRALRDPHRFAESLARVAALVGSDRVGTPVLADTHRPDAFTLVTPAREIPAWKSEAVHPPQGLVLRRFRPPQPVIVLCTGSPLRPAHVQTFQSGRPSPAGPGSTASANQPAAPSRARVVQAVHGPWRAAGDWWQADRVWQREEWDVELDGLYRLVRTPEGWFLEGEYD